MRKIIELPNEVRWHLEDMANKQRMPLKKFIENVLIEMASKDAGKDLSPKRMRVKTKELHSILKQNRISVRQFGEDIFPNDVPKRQEQKAGEFINNRMKKITPEMIKRVCHQYDVKPNDFLVMEGEENDV